MEKTLNLIRAQELEHEEYNDEYDDSFDALAGHGRWDGEAEAETSIHGGAACTADFCILESLLGLTDCPGSGEAPCFS